jgi:glucosamine-6-phosphate isomerase
MELNIYKDYDTLSQRVADDMIELVRRKPTAAFCLASGDTPRLPYKMLIQKAAEQEIDFTRCTFIGLDEWVGIPPQNEGSCHYFLQKLIFEPLCIAEGQIHLFDGLSKDLASECRRLDKVVSEQGGIDLMVVGIGMNGHIGFNEPGISVDHYAHVVDLDEGTRTVGQKYFSQKTTLTKGITMGLSHLLAARKKADVIKKALEEDITIDLPASIIRKHSNGIVMLDEEAASALKK